MYSAGVRLRTLVAVLAVLATAWLAPAAPAPEKDADLRNQALKLNDVTGDEPIKGKIEGLVRDKPMTKKLLATAVAMVKESKEKDLPFTYNALYILARTAHRLDDKDTSETFYRLAARQALELKSGSRLVQSYGGLIDVLFDSQKYDECEKICKEFLGFTGDETVDKLQGLVLRRLIQTYARQEKFKEANKLVDAMIKAQPDNWLTLDLKAWVQREAGEYEASAKTYEDVLDRVTKDKDLTKEERDEFTADVRYHLSNVYLELGKLDKVTEELEALIAKEPDNPGYKNDLGYIWADHDMNLEKAEKLIREALALDKKLRKDNPNAQPGDEDRDNGAYLDSLGWVLFKKKKYEEAKKALLEAVKEKDGQHVEIYDHLGDVYLALGDKGEAVAAWKKGVEVAGTTKHEKEKKAQVEKKIKENEK
jgi:tetratricopeptide (TPR) repeat protein